MRLGCVFGSLLMLLGFAIMGFFIMPTGEDAGTIHELRKSFLCQPDDQLVYRYQMRMSSSGMSQGNFLYCISPSGEETDVTMQSMIYVFGGFMVPFNIGLVITIVAAQKMKTQATTDLMSQALGGTLNDAIARGSVQVTKQNYTVSPDNFDLDAFLKQLNINDPDIVQTTSSSRSSSGSKTLTEKLKDLQTAYDKHLISKEEYDRLRQRILDGDSGSS